MTDLPSLLAQAATTQPKGQPAPSLFNSPLPLLVGLFAIMYFVMIRPQGKERKLREAMLKAIKKNDRVVTVSGILGVVQSVKDDEVVLKVDESSNTKITFTRSAIGRVISAGPMEPAATNGATGKK
ncbi:MAG: preprotein translocase subunit YajC [Planctomycetes bacterium]|nr:preprotein translocase subunit YajC [Planctomycetota bacterium]